MYKNQKLVYSKDMAYNVRNSDSVFNVQVALNELNNAGLPTSGNYLDMTVAAVRDWQTKQGWTGSDADGIVGPLTAKTLGLTWTTELINAALLKIALDGLDGVVWETGWNDPKYNILSTFKVKYVIMHHTAGTDSLELLKPNGKYNNVAAANFLVDKDGTIHVISAFKTYQAGEGSYPGIPTDLMNDYSYGIEIESLGTSKNMPDVQIAAAAKLAGRIVTTFGNDYSSIINHKTWSSTGKPDTLYSDEFWQTQAAQASIVKEYLTKDEVLALLSDYLKINDAKEMFVVPADLESFVTVAEADDAYVGRNSTVKIVDA